MKKSAKSKTSTVPRVRLVKPRNRPIQLRYFCPEQRRQVRISTGTRDEDEAIQQLNELQAKLLLGIETTRKAKRYLGPKMLWADFREEYRKLHLAMLSTDSAVNSESRLDMAEKLLSPRVLADMADPNALHQLQAELLAGAGSRFRRQRSPHSVRSYMTSVTGALSWAHLQGWLPSVPKIRRIKVSKLKKMKGRPLTSEEFQKMLANVSPIVGEAAAESWKYLLRGLWESALRLEELMHLSWDDASMIQPEWRKGKHPVLHIPHGLQKNATEEDITLLPGFEQVLLETPAENRKGWIFQPESLQGTVGRKDSGRPLAEWVGKIVSRIGKKATIVVVPKNEKSGKPEKFASAHDLRRSCAQRLLDSGVPPLVISRVLRHSSWETTRKYYAPGDVQNDGEAIRAAQLKEQGA